MNFSAAGIRYLQFLVEMEYSGLRIAVQRFTESKVAIEMNILYNIGNNNL